MKRVIALVGAAVLLVSGACAQTGDAAADFSVAMDLFRAHKWRDAASAFRQVEFSHPGKTTALLYVAKAFINDGELKAAEQAIDTYVSQRPQSDEALYLLAYIKFRENDPKESLRLSTRAAAIQAPQSDDLKIVALDYVLLKDLPSASKWLQEALRLDPRNIDARYALGRVLYEQNLFDQAIAEFKQVVTAEAGNSKAWNNLGLALEGKNQNREAEEAYRKAVTLDAAASSHSEQPYLNLGMLLTRSHRAPEGISYMLKAAEIDPKLAKSHRELGKAYYNLGQDKQARAELEQAAQLDPADSGSHYLLGRTYERLHDKAAAAQEFRRTQELLRAKQSANAGSGMSSSP